MTTHENAVKDNLEKAMDAFWEVIAEAYPEAQSGDLDISTVCTFQATAEAAVNRWVDLNVPTPTPSTEDPLNPKSPKEQAPMTTPKIDPWILTQLTHYATELRLKKGIDQYDSVAWFEAIQSVAAGLTKDNKHAESIGVDWPTTERCLEAAVSLVNYGDWINPGEEYNRKQLLDRLKAHISTLGDGSLAFLVEHLESQTTINL